MIKPEKLNRWDIIIVISSSRWGPGACPHRYMAGKKQLEEEFGVKVKESKYALADPDWLISNPKKRAEDFMQAFLDTEAKAIFSSIWWNDAIKLLPYIDFDIIKQNPKIYMWYSDSTVNHFFCYKAWLSSFYWPAIMSWFGENWWLFSYMIDSIKKILFKNVSINKIIPNNNVWTSEYLPREDIKNQNIIRKREMSDWWRRIQWKWKVNWILLWWCMPVLEDIKLTSLRPLLDERKDKVMFLEVSESQPDIETVISRLRNYGYQWILNQITWIIFWRSQKNHKTWEQINYDDTFLKVVWEEYGRKDMPIITNMDFGHTDPMFVLPYGISVTIDCDNQSFCFNESACI